MADDADRARQLQQSEIERGIANRKPTPDLKARGRCYYCESPVGPRQLFCDSDCASDFEREWLAGHIRYRDLHR